MRSRGRKFVTAGAVEGGFRSISKNESAGFNPGASTTNKLRNYLARAIFAWPLLAWLPPLGADLGAG